MKGKDSCKGMPSGKGKGKGDGKNKGGKQPPQHTHNKQSSPSKQHQAHHKPLENRKLPRPKKAGVLTMALIGQMTGQRGTHTMGMMEITPKVIGTIGHTLFPPTN